MRPDIYIVATVYFPPNESGRLREAGFRQDLKSWERNLVYHDGGISLIVVNDGDPLPTDFEWQRGQMVSLGHARNGVGVSLNQGFARAFEDSTLALNIDDDWLLIQPFDLTPWARLLVDDERVGSVKLMAPYPGIAGEIQPLRHGWGVTLERHNLVAGLRAALYHRRFFDAYGWYDEGLNAWETERLFNERFCQGQGPDVVLGLPFPWQEGMGARVELGQAAPHG